MTVVAMACSTRARSKCRRSGSRHAERRLAVPLRSPQYVPRTHVSGSDILKIGFAGREPERIAHLRNLCKSDLYFLLRYGLGRADMEHPWLFERCREVQASPKGHLDLWAREHRKSSIITFGMTIFNILNDPEVTIGIFSHTRPIAKGFLRQIKRELEANENLKAWFPDIIWDNPSKEAPKWSARTVPVP